MSDERTADVKPWDRLSGESDAAYVRFLIYRNLGPSRSIDAAWREVTGNKAGRAAGRWTNDATLYRWSERAAAWDVHVISQAVDDASRRFMEVVGRIAESLYRAIQQSPIIVRPLTLDECLKVMLMLTRLISPDALQAFRKQLYRDLEAVSEQARPGQASTA